VYITYCRRYSIYDYADTQSFFYNKQARSSGDHVQGDAAEIFIKNQMEVKWCRRCVRVSKWCKSTQDNCVCSRSAVESKSRIFCFLSVSEPSQHKITAHFGRLNWNSTKIVRFYVCYMVAKPMVKNSTCKRPYQRWNVVSNNEIYADHIYCDTRKNMSHYKKMKHTQIFCWVNHFGGSTHNSRFSELPILRYIFYSCCT
jgi:hypothetical protein